MSLPILPPMSKSTHRKLFTKSADVWIDPIRRSKRGGTVAPSPVCKDEAIGRRTPIAYWQPSPSGNSIQVSNHCSWNAVDSLIEALVHSPDNATTSLSSTSSLRRTIAMTLAEHPCKSLPCHVDGQFNPLLAQSSDTVAGWVAKLLFEPRCQASDSGILVILK